jgi:ring-1,2-phenylacetyl-CoA epoxidase subunit PaaE
MVVASDLKETFSYKAGQYLTIEVEINGNPERRAYSLSSSPTEDTLQFSVKKVEGGKVSNYLNDQVKVGDNLTVFPPEGKFIALPEAAKSKDHYFIAAGSGITPVLSMIKTLLEEEERSTIYLLYGNKTEKDIIFKGTLDSLAARYEGQLFITHTLSRVEKKKKKLFGLLGNSNEGSWSGQKGRIDDEKIAYFLREYPARFAESHYYICGPGNLITATEHYLTNQGIKVGAIHKEYFTPPSADNDVAPTSGSGQVTVLLDGEEFSVEVEDSKTILEAILDSGKNPPYSCTSGACASCMAKTISGTVTMDSCLSLDDDEVANGFILTCQSHPSGEGVKITYDDI